MGCSQPKLSRTGLRNILAFLKVELQHYLGGTQALLPSAARRGLTTLLTQLSYPVVGFTPVMGLTELYDADGIYCYICGHTS